MSAQRAPPPPPVYSPRRISRPAPPKPSSLKAQDPLLPPTSPKLITSASDRTKLQSSYKQTHYLGSRSQPNTPPPPRTTSKSRVNELVDILQQQQHKTLHYNSSAIVRPKSARVRNTKPTHRKTKLPHKSSKSQQAVVRPPPVPQHLLRSHKLDLVPELEAKKAIPPPPPKMPEYNEGNYNIMESYSPPAQEYNHNNDNEHIQQRSLSQKFKRKKRTFHVNHPQHTRVRSMGIYPMCNPNVAKETKKKQNNSEMLNALVCTQGIETYDVVFTTRVCGIELIAFDEDHNVGALVIKCHTNYAKQNVKKRSLLVSVNGELCVDTDYEELLSLISASARPLTLTFFAQKAEKNGTANRKKSTPSDDMVANDEEDDLVDAHKFPDPKKLFEHNKHNAVVVQRNYTMLYHQYMELVQFQDLTRDIINDKMSEIKRLMKETNTLKTILNTKESELQRLEMNQSTEKQKGKEILDKYQKLTQRNLFLQKQNMEQQQKIQSLEYDVKQQKIFIRERKRRAKQKEMLQQQKKRNHTHYVNYGALKQHKMPQNGLQNEIKHRLNEMQNEKMSRRKLRKPPAAAKTRRSVPNIQKTSKHVESIEEDDEDDHKSSTSKKRQSAINIFFSHFGKGRKYSNESEPETTAAHRERDRQKKKGYRKRNKNKSKSDFHKKKATSRTTRVRSNSAESNLNSTMRKETIV